MFLPARYQFYFYFRRIALLLSLYSVARILFYIFNYGYFNSIEPVLALKYMLIGMRFDISALCILNLPILVMFMVPQIIFNKNIYRNVLNIAFYTINLSALLFSLVDLGYFAFSNKRSTADLFDVLMVSSDIRNTLPGMILSFWYIPLLLVIFSAILHFSIRGEMKRLNTGGSESVIVVVFLIIVTSGLTLVGFRGGTQWRPIDRLSAANYVTPKHIPIVLNTPFTIIKTWNKSNLKSKNYFDNAAAISYFNPVRESSGAKKNPPNIVLIILESFSSEYVGAINGNQGYTPVLDSLIKISTLFDHAYANGKKSIEGLPAVIAGLPALMDAPFITSVYQANRIPSLARLLKPANYHCRFYHGGNNGTMGFDKFISLSEFNEYIGRKQYPGDDYDGHWGIYDEAFYNYMLEDLNKCDKPFLSVFFSLSSHHPYSIPDQHIGKFGEGTLPIHQSVRYSDFALGQFLKNARNTTWFKNTVFIITADHTGPLDTEKYQTTYGKYSVPIVIYSPTDTAHRVIKSTCQQTDIFATIVDITGINTMYKSFGQSLFDPNRINYAVQYSNELYQLITDKHVLVFDGKNVQAFYDKEKDPTLSINIYNGEQDLPELLLLKSIIQQYNYSLIYNTLTIDQNGKKEKEK